MSSAPRPPRLVERLLAFALDDRRFAADLLGDLAERHAARARREPLAARFDYLAAALPLVARFAPGAVAARLARLLAPRSHRPRKDSVMSSFAFDLRMSLRSLAKRPGSTALVVGTLAVGLGANAAVFGVLDALVIHPFRFADSERLVHLAERTPTSEVYDVSNLSPATFLELREECRGTLEALVGYDWWDANVRTGEGLARHQGYRTSPELFEALQVTPALGRFFTAAESEPGGERLVVLAHAFWERELGADPGVLGRTLEIDGAAHRVVGVAPRTLSFPMGAELWTPLVFTPEEAARRDRNYLGAFGRLAEGVSLDAARARFEASSAARAARLPESEAGRTLLTRTLAVGLRDAGAVPIFLLWQGAGMLVLLIGWLNVANLVLARGQERQRELALLDALGAGRGRLLRLQMTEGLLLGTLAALAALPIAAGGQLLVRNALPAGLRRYVAGWDQIGFDAGTLAFTGALALISIAAIATWPALRSLGRASGRIAGLLRESGRSAGAGVGRQRGRSALVVTEIALALTLVVASGLTLRTADRLLDGAQGYDPDRLTTFKVALPEERYADPATRRGFVRGALARLAELPGVESVGAANVLPAIGSNSSPGIVLAGESEPEPNRAPIADLRAVAGDYFGTLKLPIVSGRALGAGDDEQSAPVAVVSRSMAEQFWPGRDPLGQRFRLAGEAESWMTVVGVAGDHLHHWFSRRDAPTFFVPALQRPRFGMTFALRTDRAPSELGREIRAAIEAVDAAQPIFELRSQRDQLYESTLGPRVVAGAMSTFALLALVLAVSGVYGVMAYRVSLQARETGVRIALGATPLDVLRSALGPALRLAAIGLAIGLVASLGVGRLLGSVMRGASGFEPTVALGAALLLATAAVGAALIPVRRLLGLHPADVLRSE